MAATPTFMVALYSFGPIASSFSQPGSAWARMSGSRNAAQTLSRAAGMSAEPSIFIYAPSSVRTAASIRRRPSWMLSSHVAYESRMCASEPKSTPATVAMRASSSRNAQTSAEPAEHAALAALAEEPGDVGEGVERALRHHAASPRGSR